MLEKTRANRELVIFYHNWLLFCFFFFIIWKTRNISYYNAVIKLKDFIVIQNTEVNIVRKYFYDFDRKPYTLILLFVKTLDVGWWYHLIKPGLSVAKHAPRNIHKAC